MKENNKLKVVHTTWEEFLKEHPVKEVVDMPSLPNGYVARVVTVNAVSYTSYSCDKDWLLELFVRGL